MIRQCKDWPLKQFESASALPQWLADPGSATFRGVGGNQAKDEGMRLISIGSAAWRQLVIAMMVIAIVSTVASNRVLADADQRASEFLSALQAGDYAKAETYFTGTMQARLPPAELRQVWEQLTSDYGRLNSFAVTARTEVNGEPLCIVSLNFESGASALTARIAFDPLGKIAGLYFVPAKSFLADSQIADQRANGLVAALQTGDFQRVETAFDEVMKKALPQQQLESIWRGRTGSLGSLESWRIAQRETMANQQVRIVNLTFAKAANAFALRIAIGPTGEVSGLYFVDAVSSALPSPLVPYIKPARFRSESVIIGSGALALPGTLTVPMGQGPFPAALLVSGSGPNDRDETVGAEKPFRDLAEGLGSQEIATLRYDKRTFAHPTSIDLLHLTVDTEVIDDAILAIGLLRHRPEIDDRRIIIIGHSLGAELAPEIAKRAGGIAGLVMLAPPDRPLPRIIVDQPGLEVPNRPSVNGDAPPSGVPTIEAPNGPIYQQRNDGAVLTSQQQDGAASQQKAMTLDGKMHYWYAPGEAHPSPSSDENDSNFQLTLPPAWFWLFPLLSPLAVP